MLKNKKYLNKADVAGFFSLVAAMFIFFAAQPVYLGVWFALINSCLYAFGVGCCVLAVSYFSRGRDI